jgi:hypothetical protein
VFVRAYVRARAKMQRERRRGGGNRELWWGRWGRDLFRGREGGRGEDTVKKGRD